MTLTSFLKYLMIFYMLSLFQFTFIRIETFLVLTFNVVGIYVDEEDIATYIIKTIDDPQALNKTVYLRPPKNILSQREVVEIWEKLIGKELKKSSVSREEFLASLKGKMVLV